MLQGRPQLIDLSTGRTTWDHATREEVLQAVTDDAVLTTASAAGVRLTARAWNDGRELWTQDRTLLSVTAAGSGRTAPLLVDADVELASWTLVVSPTTGELQVAGLGELVGHGDGWFATFAADFEAKRYGKSGGVRVFRLP